MLVKTWYKWARLCDRLLKKCPKDVVLRCIFEQLMEAHLPSDSDKAYMLHIRATLYCRDITYGDEWLPQQVA